MDLFEYQARDLFEAHNIPVLGGAVAVTAAEAETAAASMGGKVVVKAQVKIGGRGKAGGVKLAENAADARVKADAILGMDIKGHTVHKVMIAQAAPIANQAAFAKIDALLKPDQKAKFATLRATFGQRRGARQAGAMTAGTVYVLRKEKPVAVAVRVGGTDGTNTEIQGELMAGDMVITGGGPKQKIQARSLLSVAGGNAARGGGGGRPGG